ncbi:MAG: nucleotide-binding protein [Thaumarchaeota archaeon]|nr:nucleotide-binding protein [Nitrososphaerota archaeon]
MKKTKNSSQELKKTVFVVHGRNNEIREDMFIFLQSIGLHPLEWSEIVSKTGKGSPYVGEILDTGFSISQAVVVIMTPDDEAILLKEFQGSNEPDYETNLTSQPRQNVLYEAGMAMGSFPDRTVIVEIGKLRPFSDVIGRHVVRMNNSTERRQDLAQRLEDAGCDVNLKGTRWHKAGNFELKQDIKKSDEKENEEKNTFVDEGRSSLAKFCGISSDEIENVVSMNNGEIEIVTVLEGNDTKKQFVGTLCILIVNELEMKENWMSSSKIKNILKSAGVGSLPNFAANIKKQKGIFKISGTGSNTKYGLTTSLGRKRAKEYFSKLARGELNED